MSDTTGLRPPVIQTLPEYYAWREKQPWWQEGERHRQELKSRLAPSFASLPRAAGFFVYRLWDALGRCLYVGMVGKNGPRLVHFRLAEHRRCKDWWSEVARIDVIESAPDRVREEEAIQILTHNPLRNVRKEARSLPRWARRG